MTQRLHLLWAPVALFYQARRDIVERGLTAAGLTILVGSFIQGNQLYPPEWVVVLIIALFALTVYHRTMGYLSAVALIAWPLWELSPYLSTLFLAVSILGRELLVEYLEWTILIAGAPLLAPYGLTALIPLCAGIFLGAVPGFWVGVLLALWLKVVAGMAGLQPDMLSLHQYLITLDNIGARFRGADSLETLRLIVAPFAGSSTFLLLDLLQLLLWGLGGYLVGWLRHLPWAEREPWVSLIPALLLGGLLLWISMFVVPIWLELAPVALLWSDLIITSGLVASVGGAASLYALRYVLRRPVRRWRPTPVSSHRSWPESAPAAHASSTSQPSSHRASPTPRPVPPGDDSPTGDVIMLELD